MYRDARVLLWLLSNKSPPDGEIQLKQNIWAPSGVFSPHDLMQFRSGPIVNLSQVFGQMKAGSSDWFSLMLSEFRKVRRRQIFNCSIKMIPLISLTFILATTAIKGAVAQNATDTNQVRGVQCCRYGTCDNMTIWQYKWHYKHNVTWHKNWPGHWRIPHLHRLSGLCLRHLDLFCLQVFPALCFVFCVLCFVLCVNLLSTWYNFVCAQYLFSTDIFVLSLCEASLLLLIDSVKQKSL